MKKIALYNILLLAIICNSCVWQEADERGNLTQRGKQIYDAWDNSSQTILNEFVDKAFHFNAWYLADDSMKRIIEDNWFPYYKIRDDGDGAYGLYYGGTLTFSIETNRQNLSDSCASWTITRHNFDIETNTHYSYEPVINNVTIHYANNMVWNIHIDSTNNSSNFALWQLRVIGNSIPQAISSADYEFSGQGLFALQNEETIGGRNGNSPVFLKYTITEIFNHTRGANWESGAVDILLYNEKSETCSVEAVVLNRETLRIHYAGVTENWEINN